ncbi:hypothetical protein Nepgr_021535 [Nepenthes gracilis]|uniref:Uncharacterized protein n=1 Tax=Nepenthes gracilis TaxID=150966 RepID=A0AAD3XX46_NEPGR|nr:hypothetical protein Nepgr_021535 [Nepenthes gracilis]
MVRSSRIKLGKQSSREARDYSDSEKGLSLKDKMGKGSASGEKRKLDSKSMENKDSVGCRNDEYLEGYGVSSSKKRKEKVDEDRWTGGDFQREASKTERNLKDSKGLGDSKSSRSSRRDDNLGLGVDGEGGKRSGSKAEPKHHTSDGKEKNEKEVGSERERKVKDITRSERLLDGEVRTDIMGCEGSTKLGYREEHTAKHVAVDIGLSPTDDSRNPELVREVERRVKRKRESSGDGDKHPDGVRDLDDRRLSSRGETAKSGRYKDEVQKGKYREDVEKDSGRSNDKHSRNEKKELGIPHRKSKLHDSRDHDRSCHNLDRHDHDRQHSDRDHGPDRDCERGRDRSRDLDQRRDWDRDRDLDRERYRREHGRDRIHDCGQEWDRSGRDYTSHLNNKSSQYKEESGRKRSSNDYGDLYNNKSKIAKVEGGTDMKRSLSRKAYMDNVTSSGRTRTSPSSKSHISIDGYRGATHEDFKHGDSKRGATSKSETLEKVSEYQPTDKHAKLDDNHLSDLSAERASCLKALPTELTEISFPPTNVNHKYTNRTAGRKSLDVDEAERRSPGSNDARFYHKSGKGNASSLVPELPRFRNGGDSPSFLGSMGEEGRIYSTGHHRRSVDLNIGRAHGNTWKGALNWPSPLPNGFMPFPPGPHGPPHGLFPGMIPQFPPPIYSVRPSMEMNHHGIPYMHDADRFSSHVSPFGWPNIAEGSGAHFRFWDTNNGVSRDESPLSGTGHLSNGLVWETNTDTQNQNGTMNLGSGSQKDGQVKKTSAEETNFEGNFPDAQGKGVAMKMSNGSSQSKEALASPTKVAREKTPELSPVDDAARSLRSYLSKLDIAVDLVHRELYDQFRNLVEGEHIEDAYEDVIDHVPSEESAGIPTRGFTLFPTVEDSLFQRAMDLYKAESRRSMLMSGRLNRPIPLASEGNGVVQTSVREEEMDKPDCGTSGQDIREQALTTVDLIKPEGSISTPDVEVPENLSLKSRGLEMQTSILENTKSQAGVLSDEGMPQNAGITNETKVTFVGQGSGSSGGGSGGESSTCAEPQLGGTVSGPLNLLHGSVTGCEALILNRIHPDPESIH